MKTLIISLALLVTTAACGKYERNSKTPAPPTPTPTPTAEQPKMTEPKEEICKEPTSLDIEIQPNFASLDQHIFSQKCASCHNAFGQVKFLDFSSYEAMMKIKDKILVSGNPDASLIIEVLRDTEEPMPPKWSKLKMLSEVEIQAIADWIQLGTPKE